MSDKMNRPMRLFLTQLTGAIVVLICVPNLGFAASKAPAKEEVDFRQTAQQEVLQNSDQKSTWHEQAGLTGRTRSSDNSLIRLAASPLNESAPKVRFFAGVTTSPIQWKGTSNWGPNKTYDLKSIGQVWMTEIEAGAHGLVGNPTESPEFRENSQDNSHEYHQETTLKKRLGWLLGGVFGIAQKSLKTGTLSGESETEVRQVNWSIAPTIKVAIDQRARSAVLVRWQYGQSYLMQNNPDANVQWGENHRFWSVGLGFSQNLVSSLSAKLIALSIRDLSPNEAWNLSQNTYQLGLQYQW